MPDDFDALMNMFNAHFDDLLDNYVINSSTYSLICRRVCEKAGIELNSQTVVIMNGYGQWFVREYLESEWISVLLHGRK
jgi:hypothetical protein